MNVHIQKQHAGIYGQWISTWRPHEASNELAIFLEDDVDISPFAYRWLKAAHTFYKNQSNIAGYSLFEADIVNMKSLPSDIAFLHRRFGSHGFAPHPKHWRGFQDWYIAMSRNPKFHPYVKNDRIVTGWYKSFEARHLQDRMWSMWFIYYSDKHDLWTLYPNIAGHILTLKSKGKTNTTKEKLIQKYLAYHRQENGLHFKGKSRRDHQKLIDIWNDTYITFSDDLAKYSFDGSHI